MKPKTVALPALERMPGGVVMWWLLALLMAGIVTLLATVDAATGQGVPNSWQHGLLVVSGALLLPMPFFTLGHLRAQRRVWLGRVAPLGAWQQALATHWHTLLLAWAVVAVPLALLRLLNWPSHEPAGNALVFALGFALWPLAWLGGLLGLALLLAAAMISLLGWRWGWGAALGLLAVSAAGAGASANGTGSWALTLQFAGLAALGPLALWWVQRLLAKAPLNTAAMGPGPWQKLRQWRDAVAERWRTVESPAATGMPIFVGMQLINPISRAEGDMSFFQAWGSSVSPMHGLRLLVFTAFAAAVLRGAHLHWRVLLAPGGCDRSQIGLRVVGATLASMLGLAGAVLLLMGLAWAALPFLPPVPWSKLPDTLVRYGPPLLADLALAVALAAWLRAALGSLLRVVLACSVVAAALSLGAWLGSGSLPEAATISLWSRGIGHHVISLGLACVFTALAQRAWMRVDLHELARRGKAEQDNAGWR